MQKAKYTCISNKDNTLRKRHLSKHWMVVFTKSRCEKKLHHILTKEGYESFLPLYTTLHQWSDRKKKVELPLINGVLFLKTNVKNLRMVYQNPFVSGILKEFGKPGIVKEEEIKNLKIIASEWNNDIIESHSAFNFRSGDYIEIKHGPFAGITGNLVNINGKHRLVVHIKSINVDFLINVPKSQVKKIESMHGKP
ncbi:MAG: UpxY family transcription antiterminator [Bacteroidota bacterium]